MTKRRSSCRCSGNPPAKRKSSVTPWTKSGKSSAAMRSDAARSCCSFFNRIKYDPMHLLLFATLLFSPQEDLKQLQAVVNTSAGSFIMEFYPDQAPNHVRKFIELARQGFYNGTIFHSMAAHGIVQGGDPETKNPQARARYGTGGF